MFKANRFTKSTEICLWQHFRNACILHQSHSVLKDKIDHIDHIIAIYRMLYSTMLSPDIGQDVEIEENYWQLYQSRFSIG